MADADDGSNDEKRIRIADLILRLRRAGVTDQKVVAAIESIPRELFVPNESQPMAYSERALPIDCGQTISAPVIVGLMTAALDVGDRDRILEIGTGSGYQAAVLSRLVRRVYTMDRFRTLVEAAESRWRTLRLTNITSITSDGTKGWPEQAPFDGIVVTAAGDAAPDALLRQVRVGGVIVMPIGPVDGIQKLTRLVRTEDGFDEKILADVRFVPLIPGRAERL